MPEATKPPDDPTQIVSGAIPTESVLPANAGDSATNNDQLGFEPYVRALAEFLTNPATSGPLTVSVEGEWGSGKSSFMLQLEERLRAIAAGKPQNTPHRRPLTIRFNAWRHDKDEALWAAFATEFARKIAINQGVGRRMWGHLRLFIRRFRWRQGWPDLARTVLSWLFLLTAVIILSILLYQWGWLWLIDFLRQIPAPNTEKPETWSAWVAWIQRFGRAGIIVGYLTIIFSGWVKIKKYFGNPLESDLRKYLRTPNYDQRVSFIEQFHEDFSRIIDAYAGDKTIYVFIDDLDRCEIPKAAELMQALNLLVSGDQRGLIFVIGMDREKVAAGLAVKNEKLLPYLYGSQATSKALNDRTDLKGLEFGYEFIEKFIQIPFVVPQPAEQNLETFFGSVSQPNTVNPGRPFLVRLGDRLVDWFSGQQYGDVRRRKGPVAVRVESTKEDQTKGNVQPEAIKKREGLKLLVTGDSERIQNIVLTLAPVLSNNPRRIKQFINLFRLKVFIAAETGLFDGEEALTLEQLGKFVAITLRWPLLHADLEADGELLKRINDMAFGLKQEGLAAHWAENEELQRAIRAGFKGQLDSQILSGSRWNLQRVNVKRLMQVSPRVRTINLGDEAMLASISGSAHGTSTVSATLTFPLDTGVTKVQTSSAFETPATQELSAESPSEFPESVNNAHTDDREMESSDWQRVDVVLSPLSNEFRDAYREALRILLRDGAATERFTLKQLQQQKLAMNWGSIFSQMQITTNLVQPFPGQPEPSRSRDKEWQIRPALQAAVASYLRRHDDNRPA